jgi:ribosomal-protein-alanine N-acetyltransferase
MLQPVRKVVPYRGVADQCGLLMQRNVDGRDEVEIGYSFVRRHWNSGFATEAAIACRNFGFADLNLSHLVSLIDPANRASRRVAEKVGRSWDRRVSGAIQQEPDVVSGGGPA